MWNYIKGVVRALLLALCFQVLMFMLLMLFNIPINAEKRQLVGLMSPVFLFLIYFISEYIKSLNND